MNNFLDLLMSQFGGPIIDLISVKLGLDREQTKLALSQYLPIIARALAGNASNSAGAQSLYKAVEEDHDGSILGQLVGFLNNYQNGPGSGINRHVFGGQSGLVADFISRSTGIDAGRVSSIMQIASPLVLGLLGKQQKEERMDETGLAGWLLKSQEQVQETDPINTSMIGRLLDADGDGSIMDEVASMGMGFLKSWMSGRPASMS